VASRVFLNHSAIADILSNSPALAEELMAAAEAVNAALPPIPVHSPGQVEGSDPQHAATEVTLTRTGRDNRLTALVTLAHPAAQGLEARHSYLARAAAETGLELGRRD